MKNRILSVAAAAVALCLGITLPHADVQAASRDDLVNQKQKEESRLSNLRADLEGVDVDLQKAYLSLEETRGKIPAAQQALADATNELMAAQREAEAKAALLAAAQSELEDIENVKNENESQAAQTRQSLGELARASYRGEVTPSAIELIFGTSSADEFLDAYQANEALSRTQSVALTRFEQSAAQAQNQGARQEAVEQRVAELKAESDALVETKAQIEAEAQAKQDELTALEASLTEQSAALEAQQGALKQSIADVQAEQQKLSAEIARIDEENRKAAAAAAAARARSGAATPPAGGNAGNTGYWLQPPIPRPLQVNSPMGWRIHPVTGARALHYGVDLQSACGAQQTAAGAGTVASTQWAGTGGNMVTINHGIVDGHSWVTRYMHLSAFKVSPGQRVSQGQLIGLTGATGRVTGCHVHFEVWRDGAVINPMTLPGF
ncbi:MAG: peptidoglycan DD-metalloendopeptidase family protein [Actinomycetaceae bacterium]|nr:peptidoglycan DD-metalloendopeptidase family protein [Arcanobacterium sp.]MDD7504368.1 peptidoglycan DD-metalloendopeptidase family protein [Actinomycetaceae bacterium]